MWSEQQRLFLGINAKEYLLLRTLQKQGSRNTLALAFEAKLPRVTAIRILRRLSKRGYVSRQVLKCETMWSLVNSTLLQRRFLRDVEVMHTGSKEIKLSEVASVAVYRGAEEMIASNKKILIAHAGERIYCIEPNAMWKHAAKIPSSEWVQLNKLLKQKNVVAEVILETGFEKVLRQHVDKMWSDSFFALAKNTSVMPRGILSSPVEVIIFRDQVLFLDWEQYIAVEIKNPNTLRVLKGLFKTLQHISTPYGER